MRVNGFHQVVVIRPINNGALSYFLRRLPRCSRAFYQLRDFGSAFVNLFDAVRQLYQYFRRHAGSAEPEIYGSKTIRGDRVAIRIDIRDRRLLRLRDESAKKIRKLLDRVGKCLRRCEIGDVRGRLKGLASSMPTRIESVRRSSYRRSVCIRFESMTVPAPLRNSMTFA